MHFILEIFIKWFGYYYLFWKKVQLDLPSKMLKTTLTEALQKLNLEDIVKLK